MYLKQVWRFLHRIVFLWLVSPLQYCCDGRGSSVEGEPTRATNRFVCCRGTRHSNLFQYNNWQAPGTRPGAWSLQFIHILIIYSSIFQLLLFLHGLQISWTKRRGVEGCIQFHDVGMAQLEAGWAVWEPRHLLNVAVSRARVGGRPGVAWHVVLSRIRVKKTLYKV